jgi:hypothetical protein
MGLHARLGCCSAHARTRRARHTTVSSLFSTDCLGEALAHPLGVVWFFEKDSNLVVCEIRRAADDGSRYEFEIADAEGPKTQRFNSSTELISKYLAEQSRLIKDGWRPRADLQVVD